MCVMNAKKCQIIEKQWNTIAVSSKLIAFVHIDKIFMQV